MFLLLRWLTIGNHVRGINLVRCLLQSPACIILVIHKRIVGVVWDHASKQANEQSQVSLKALLVFLLMQASKQASKQASEQASQPASKHRENISKQAQARGSIAHMTHAM